MRILGQAAIALLMLSAVSARADVGDFEDFPEETPVAEAPGWQVVFADPMTNITLHGGWLSGDWAVRGGHWEGSPEGVRKTGPDEEAVLMLRRPLLRGAFRVEYEAYSETPGDLSLVLGLPTQPEKLSRYTLFLFGAGGNTRSSLLVPGRPLVTSDTLRITPGRWHRIAVERRGGRMSAEVDGERVMEGLDSTAGLEAPYLALYGWSKGLFRNVRVSTRPDPALADFLTPAAREREASFPTIAVAMQFMKVPDALMAEATTQLYVSQQGDDRWSGLLSAPAADGSDGPFATTQRALDEVGVMRTRDGGLIGPVNVNMQGGTHFLKQPLLIVPAIAGKPGNKRPHIEQHAEPLPITIRSKTGAHATISGGKAITGLVETQVHSQRAWVAELPEVKSGAWKFAQLWVNGARRERPRLPREGWYHVEGYADGRPLMLADWRDPADRFIYQSGNIQAGWTNLTDVEIHTYNFWLDQRLGIASVDPAQRLVVLDRTCTSSMCGDEAWNGITNGARYVVENVYEALTEPGQWYLDRTLGRLTYLPLPGETLATAEVIAPVMSELARIEGTTNELVQEVWFEDVTLAHTTWIGPTNWPGSSQAANEVPGAIVFRNAQDCGMRRCRVTHVGNYAVELAEGCWRLTLAGNTLEDLGAGGIKVWHGCDHNLITDNTIAHGGQIFAQAVGILVGRSAGNRILHNHIFDMGYTGISVGWRWGYDEGAADGNIVEYNHIHDIGRNALSDMGGIYTLGPQQGARLRYNLIHDVVNHGYGGWGIYTDEGSSFILIEKNLAYRCKTGGFNQHYGEGNEIRNNIFAMGGIHELARGRSERHTGFIFERNIVVGNQPNMWTGAWSEEINGAELRYNIYWNLAGSQMIFGGHDFDAWQRRGLDVDSHLMDPKFRDPEHGDFSFKSGSPYARIGFVPFDLSEVGPRPDTGFGN